MHGGEQLAGLDGQRHYGAIAGTGDIEHTGIPAEDSRHRVVPRLVGPAIAAELVYTAGMIGAERAERLGLFNRVVAAVELEPSIRGLAGQIAAGPREVITAARRSLRRSLETSLPQMLELEIDAQIAAFRSPDFQEGVAAFLEKRAPRFARRASGGGRS